MKNRGRRLTDEQFLRATDASALLHPVLLRDDWGAVLHSLMNLDRYVEGARVQLKRLDMCHRRVFRDFARARVDPSPRLWWLANASRPIRGRTTVDQFSREVHFYSICWSAVVRDLILIRDVTRWKNVKTALRPHARLLSSYKDMRHHFEHFDERLPGRPGRARLKNPHDMGSFSRSVFSFGGDEIDISWEGFHRLERVVAAVRDALKREAWQRIQTADPRLAQRLMTNALRDREARKWRRSFNHSG